MHEKNHLPIRKVKMSEVITGLFKSSSAASNAIFRLESAGGNLSDYYPKRRIFISYDVAEKIDLFRLELSRIVQEIEVSGPDYYFSSMYDRVRNDASETLSDLEKDFRDLLGEKSTKKSS
jgi:chromosome condensin MukBEF complex kleisin-like MukF subunit